MVYYRAGPFAARMQSLRKPLLEEQIAFEEDPIRRGEPLELTSDSLSECGRPWADFQQLPASTREDLSRIELVISEHLKGEGGRCPWLRSQGFLRLRLTALYFPRLCDHQPIVLYHQGLRVTLFQGTVTLARVDPTQGCYLRTLEEYALLQDGASAPPSVLGKRGRR